MTLTNLLPQWPICRVKVSELGTPRAVSATSPDAFKQTGQNPDHQSGPFSCLLVPPATQSTFKSVFLGCGHKALSKANTFQSVSTKTFISIYSWQLPSQIHINIESFLSTHIWIYLVQSSPLLLTAWQDLFSRSLTDTVCLVEPASRGRSHLICCMKNPSHHKGPSPILPLHPQCLCKSANHYQIPSQRALQPKSICT